MSLRARIVLFLAVLMLDAALVRAQLPAASIAMAAYVVLVLPRIGRPR